MKKYQSSKRRRFFPTSYSPSNVPVAPSILSDMSQRPGSMNKLQNLVQVHASVVSEELKTQFEDMNQSGSFNMILAVQKLTETKANLKRKSQQDCEAISKVLQEKKQELTLVNDVIVE